MSNYGYSEKEIQLFLEFEEKDNIEFMIKHYTPIRVYEYLASFVFIKNITGLATDSLRRCLIELYNSNDNNKIYRNTTEFDNLIILE